MATSVCPKGHESTEPDYCSECGARMGGAPEAAAAAPTPPAVKTCPECGTPREQTDVVFCEICGYNFVTGAPGDSPVPPTPAPPTPPVKPRSWSVEVSVDPALHPPGSPEPPPAFQTFTIALPSAPSLIGRRSTARAIQPEIDLSHDAAVSHRHALLQFDPAGQPVLRDIGASNGTRLNGQPIAPLKDHPLAPNDEITLGHWSRLVLKAAD